MPRMTNMYVLNRALRIPFKSRDDLLGKQAADVVVVLNNTNYIFDALTKHCAEKTQ